MDQERFTEHLTLHLSPRQKKLLKAAAKKRGMSLGGMVRWMIDGLEEGR